jgi:hypothetical protein
MIKIFGTSFNLLIFNLSIIRNETKKNKRKVTGSLN